MKIVFFMGAGFSAPFKLPTMNRFLTEVASTKSLDSAETIFIHNLVLDARRANSILESSPTNLEDMLSFAVMGDRIGLFGEDGTPKGPQIKTILRKIYSTIKDKMNYYRMMKQFKVFMSGNLKEMQKDICFVTTNYDLIIESVLLFNGLNSILPFKYLNYEGECKQGRHPIKQFKFYDDKSGIKLYKLHGSINWFTSDNKAIGVDDRLVEYKIGDLKFLEPIQSLPDYNPTENLLLIPPTFLKPDLPVGLLNNWTGAAKEIQQAEIIIFVGYSFPSSDIEMKYFLARSLENNPVLRKIIILNPNADHIVRRLSDTSSGFGSHFRNFLKPSVGSWTEKDIDQILSNL